MAIGVPRPLALEKPQSVDLAQAARYFGAHGEPDAATLAPARQERFHPPLPP